MFVFVHPCGVHTPTHLHIHGLYIRTCMHTHVCVHISADCGLVIGRVYAIKVRS